MKNGITGDLLVAVFHEQVFCNLVIISKTHTPFSL